MIREYTNVFQDIKAPYTNVAMIHNKQRAELVTKIYDALILSYVQLHANIEPDCNFVAAYLMTLIRNGSHS